MHEESPKYSTRNNTVITQRMIANDVTGDLNKHNDKHNRKCPNTIIVVYVNESTNYGSLWKQEISTTILAYVCHRDYRQILDILIG